MSSERLTRIQMMLWLAHDLETHWSPTESGALEILIVPLSEALSLRLALPPESPERPDLTGFNLFFFADFGLTLPPAAYPLLGLFDALLPLGGLEMYGGEHLCYRCDLALTDPWSDSCVALDIIQCLRHLLPLLKRCWQELLAHPQPMLSALPEAMRAPLQALIQTRPRRHPVPPPGFLTALKKPLQRLLAGLNPEWEKHRQLHQQAIFYLQRLQQEHTQAALQQQQVRNWRDCLAQQRLDLNQQSPESPAQLLRAHQRITLIDAFQDMLIQQATQLKWLQQNLTRSREKLVQDYRRFRQHFPGRGALSTSDLSERISAMLRYAGYASRCWSSEPLIQIAVRTAGAPVQLSLETDWDRHNRSAQTWLMRLEAFLALKIPAGDRRAVLELLPHLNTRITVGRLIYEPSQRQLSLTWHQVFLRGDFNLSLLHEGLQTLSFFTPRLRRVLTFFLHHRPSLLELQVRLEQELQGTQP
jgi:hypothetical protein